MGRHHQENLDLWKINVIAIYMGQKRWLARSLNQGTAKPVGTHRCTITESEPPTCAGKPHMRWCDGHYMLCGPG